jgi:hypothetical protein
MYQFCIKLTHIKFSKNKLQRVVVIIIIIIII